MRSIFAIAVTAIVVAYQISEVEQVTLRIRSRFETAAGPTAGFVTNIYGGGPSGLVWTVVRRGDRLASRIDEGMAGRTGPTVPDWIVDFNEHNTYQLEQLDPAGRKYVVKTFRQVLGQLSSDHRNGEQAAPDVNDLLPTTGVSLPRQSRSRGKAFEFASKLEMSGQTRVVAGHACQQAVMRLDAHEKGKTLETDGGWATTSTICIGPRLKSVDAVMDLQRGYQQTISKGVFAAVFADTEMWNAHFMDSSIPEHVFVAARLLEDMQRLPGTVLASSTVYEMERTPAEYKRAVSQYEAQQKRLTATGARVVGGAPPKRTGIITMEFELLTIINSANANDVAIPPGFAVKK